ncbi:exo-beta-N-acetylmuramidase NamZ family protein [Sphingobacterium chuzhouense]|uniref:DUF1343 domain-containing protein n=1 Tax=Sphingobacterium chuzhouense TaxID=1742264 RepID=A0ABR7XXW0_9SPHI|nr:DUF1343 domain-containing protein [Sphingobacterium chuzhouense]MBD1423888.1 DUF1343 domain-containing protein [Sphingobacterium chuzhouense]
MKRLACLLFVLTITFAACAGGNTQNSRENEKANTPSEDSRIIPAADQLEAYLPLLKGKKVGLMGNQTSIVGEKKEHLVDVLLRENVDLKFAFAPEHGFRGDIERGEKVDNTVDKKTGLTLHTLYGENAKADSIVGSVDVMLFDLQDVGARFYTYVASMHRVMQLCANQGKKVIVLDRPNPNGDQVDGPVRKDDKFKANISYHKIAMIHGLTVGELAKMINGEGWLDGGATCDLEVIPVRNWDHGTPYELPVVPSPSLPNYASVRLYMSLCLFEGTDISIGRGTDWPFQVVGYPDPVFGEFTFTPGTRPGMAAHVEQQDNLCYGIDLRNVDAISEKFTLKYLLDFYNKMPDKSKFFARPEFFDKLAGTDELRKQIIAGKTENEIRNSWAEELKAYKEMRKKYLLYPDFE